MIAIDSLETRLAKLEDRLTYRLKLRDVDLLRVQPGDIVVMNIARPVASDEREAICNSWNAMMASLGHTNVSLVILGGGEVSLSVMRGDTC